MDGMTSRAAIAAVQAGGSLMRRDLLAGVTAFAVVGTSAAESQIATHLSHMAPENEWPDPQFCIQDANSLVTAIDDALSGALQPYAVTGYDWATAANVTTLRCRCANTRELNVGDFVQFQSPADAALRATILRVTAVTTDTAFEVVLEYLSGVPTASTACAATPVQRGDVDGASGGQVTSNLMRGPGGLRA